MIWQKKNLFIHSNIRTQTHTQIHTSTYGRRVISRAHTHTQTEIFSLFSLSLSLFASPFFFVGSSSLPLSVSIHSIRYVHIAAPAYPQHIHVWAYACLPAYDDDGMRASYGFCMWACTQEPNATVKNGEKLPVVSNQTEKKNAMACAGAVAASSTSSFASFSYSLRPLLLLFRIYIYFRNEESMAIQSQS